MKLWTIKGKLIKARGDILRTCNKCPCIYRTITISGCIDHYDRFVFNDDSIKWYHESYHGYSGADPGMHEYCKILNCHKLQLSYPWVLVNGEIWNLKTGDFKLPFVIDDYPSGKNEIEFIHTTGGPSCLTESIKVIIRQNNEEDFE